MAKWTLPEAACLGSNEGQFQGVRKGSLMSWLGCQVRALSFPREEALQHHPVRAASQSEGGRSLSLAPSLSRTVSCSTVSTHLL